MKKFLRWCIGIVAALLILAAIAAIFMDHIFKAVAERRLRAQTGLDAKIGDFSVHFSPAGIRLKDLTIMNSPEFGGAVLINIPELSLELDNDQARAGKVRFKQIRFHLSELNIVKSKNGRLNVHALEKMASTNGPFSSTQRNGKTFDFQFGGIEKMYLTLDKLKYIDLGRSSRNEEINLGVENELIQNLQTEADLKQWYGAFCVRLFLQVITQQMMNSPDRAQSFAEVIKQLSQSMP